MELIEILKVVILGIIQGITEWLPISSTGHMILADTFLQLQQPKDFMDMFYVVIQLGSILAVVVLYFNKLNPFSRAKSRAERLSTFQLWFKVIVAILPIGVIGLLVDDWVTEHFYTPTVIAIALIFYGVLFILLEKRNHHVKPRIRNFEQLSYRYRCLHRYSPAFGNHPGNLPFRFHHFRCNAALLFPFCCDRIFFLYGNSGHVRCKRLQDLEIHPENWPCFHHRIPVGTASDWFAGCLRSFSVCHQVPDELHPASTIFTAFGWYRIVLGIIVILFFGAKAIFA